MARRRSSLRSFVAVVPFLLAGLFVSPSGTAALGPASAAAPTGSGQHSDRSVLLDGGLNHSCSVLATGTVKCWGGNGWGQLGDGSVENRPAPVTVVAALGSTAPLSNVVAVATGMIHTCALLGSGIVKCWGANRYGETGDQTEAGARRPGDRPRGTRHLESPVERDGHRRRLWPHLRPDRQRDRQVLGLELVQLWRTRRRHEH